MDDYQEPISDIEFINGQRTESYVIQRDGDGLNQIFIKIEKGKDFKKYQPITFLNLVLESYYIQIDKNTELSVRLTKAYDAKRRVIHFIGDFKEEMERCAAPKRDYDFSWILIQIDSTIDKIRLELDNKKYELEVKKLTIETRNYKEYVYMITAFILIFSTFFSIDKCNLPTPKSLLPTSNNVVKADTSKDANNSKKSVEYKSAH